MQHEEDSVWEDGKVGSENNREKGSNEEVVSGNILFHKWVGNKSEEEETVNKVLYGFQEWGYRQKKGGKEVETARRKNK